ncbi:acyl-CoA carboxylase subunit epsilon [Streptomyces candidus]|uniref:Acyl-CoA carboxylase subunit epsilon n=1 Tax=Streptomyces candidus TaxID=67283 RepID=A0A7X0LQ65_9ACTN|nr:acyl-CoA carboxylase subunit epsilon [Streptomyces candidus]MBB6436707.1 hypothetical protein [Streptomyces candidus]GHH51147.1 hypothetical protein GCM10018773_49200 [Streptomyces candidus]
MAEETEIIVLRGNPDAAELAAVSTVLLTLLRDRGRAPAQPPEAEPAHWSIRGADGRGPLYRGLWDGRGSR